MEKQIERELKRQRKRERHRVSVIDKEKDRYRIREALGQSDIQLSQRDKMPHKRTIYTVCS